MSENFRLDKHKQIDNLAWRSSTKLGRGLKAFEILVEPEVYSGFLFCDPGRVIFRYTNSIPFWQTQNEFFVYIEKLFDSYTDDEQSSSSGSPNKNGHQMVTHF